SHVGSVITSSLHSIAATFEHGDCGNGGGRCHHELPMGSTSNGRTIATIFFPLPPSLSPIPPLIRWVSAQGSGPGRPPPPPSPPPPSPASHPEVRLTRATSLAVLCVFRS